MKGKMKKKLIAFLLCMVLVVCNSVSILADTPAETTTFIIIEETLSAVHEKYLHVPLASFPAGNQYSGKTSQFVSSDDDCENSRRKDKEICKQMGGCVRWSRKTHTKDRFPAEKTSAGKRLRKSYNNKERSDEKESKHHSNRSLIFSRVVRIAVSLCS